MWSKVLALALSLPMVAAFGQSRTTAIRCGLGNSINKQFSQTLPLVFAEALKGVSRSLSGPMSEDSRGRRMRQRSSLIWCSAG